MTRHGSASKIVILVQTFVILYLSTWIVEEYLNNMYLRQYVSDIFQADGLIFGILGTLLVLGSVGGLFVKHRHGNGTVSLEIKTPSPMVSVAKKEEKKTLDTGFHPVVAALKADMAERRLSFGSVAPAGTERPTTVPVSSAEIRKTSVLDQLTQNRQPKVTGQGPGQMAAPFPQRQMPDLRPQAPTSARLEQIGNAGQRSMPPVLQSQQPVGSNVLQATHPPALQLPSNVTTVITGIMPAQRKKDPTSPTEEKPSSSQ
jgi:hypothetical protein